MNDDESPTTCDDTDSSERRLYDDYCKHGVVGPIDVISTSEAANLLNAFRKDTNIFPDRSNDSTIDPPSTTSCERHDIQERILHQYGQKNDNLFKPHLFVPYINQLIRHPKLILAVQTILRTNDIRCWSCDFNIREWNTPTMIAPHQDSTYAGLTPSDEVVTAWIALSDPVTPQEGGLIFYNGSHLLGQLPHTCDTIIRDDDNDMVIDTEIVGKGSIDTTATKQKLRNVLSRRQHCEIPNGTRATSIPLRAGQATLHHFYTVHASGPNMAPNRREPRVGLAVRYISANVRKQHSQVKEMITFISGRNRSGAGCRFR